MSQHSISKDNDLIAESHLFWSTVVNKYPEAEKFWQKFKASLPDEESLARKIERIGVTEASIVDNIAHVLALIELHEQNQLSETIILRMSRHEIKRKIFQVFYFAEESGNSELTELAKQADRIVDSFNK